MNHEEIRAHVVAARAEWDGLGAHEDEAWAAAHEGSESDPEERAAWRERWTQVELDALEALDGMGVAAPPTGDDWTDLQDRLGQAMDDVTDILGIGAVDMPATCWLLDCRRL